MGIITTSDSKNFLFVCLLLDVFYSIRMDKYEPVTHVIFDLDGLLLNTETISYYVSCQLCAKYGKELTIPIKRRIMGTTALRSAEIVVKELNLPITPQDYIEQHLKMMEPRFRDVVVKPGAEKLMQHLHRNNIPFAVATSTTHEKYLLKTQNFMKLFSVVDHLTAAGSDPEVKLGKPAPDVFLVCAKRFKDQPHSSKCLVFEDSPVGVMAAVRAGMQVVMVPDEQFVAEDDLIKRNATLVLESLEDFRPELFGLPSYNKSLIPLNEYKPVTHVIFDMDGLILNTEYMYFSMDQKVCARYGKNFTKLTKRKIIGKADLPAAEIVIKELQLPITPEDYIKQLQELPMQQRANEVTIMQGVEKLVQHLHKNGIPMAIASGGTDQQSWPLWEQKFKELFSLFHHIVMATLDPDVKQNKPAPDVYLVCAQRFADKPHPSQCLAFEDSPCGVTAAAKAGMQVVMVLEDYISDDLKQEADLVINTMENFRPELFGLPAYPDNIEK